jgi:hypothetical protein
MKNTYSSSKSLISGIYVPFSCLHRRSDIYFPTKSKSIVYFQGEKVAGDINDGVILMLFSPAHLHRVKSEMVKATMKNTDFYFNFLLF